MSDSRPIGILDSGLGGLTVVRELFTGMPDETLIYIGDTAHFPYGPRSPQSIKAFAMSNIKKLAAMDIKMLVISCNTISAIALDSICNELRDIPVVGMINPAARAAAAHTAVKRVGVIATEATIASEAYTKAIANIDPSIKTFAKACPLFVPLAKEGIVDAEITQRAAQRYLDEMIHRDVDCLILGSTYYQRLMEIIQSMVGAHVQLIDSAFWVAKEVKTMLNAVNARSGVSGAGKEKSTLYVTDLSASTQSIAAVFLRDTVPEIKKCIL